LEPTRLDFSWLEDSGKFASLAITSVEQDEHGFIWVGTHDGLHRFDGYDFVEYRFSEEDKLLNYIEVIFTDRRGDLWVGTQRELRRYNEKLDRFEVEWEGGTRKVFENESGNLFAVSSDGTLLAFDLGKKRFQPKGKFDGGVVWEVISRRSGGFWLGGEDTVYHLDEEFRTVEAFALPVPSAADPDRARNVRSIYEDDAGKLWFATGSHGFGLLDPKNGSSTMVPFEAELDQKVGKIIRGPDGFMYVGTAGGLCVYDSQANQIARYEHQLYTKGSIGRGGIYAMVFDRQGNLWIGSADGGIGRVLNLENFENMSHSPLDPNSLARIPTTAILQDSKGYFWVGYAYGEIDRFDLMSGERFDYHGAQETNSLSDRGGITMIVEDRDGVIWFGTNGSGLMRYDYETDGFRHFTTGAEEGNFIAGNRVGSIAIDEDNMMWLGIEGVGMDRFDPVTETFTQIQGISNGVNREAVLKKNGEIWVVRPRGLLRFEAKTGVQSGVDFSNEETWFRGTVNDYYEDDRGRVWLALTSGLLMVDPSSGEKRRYSPNDGLPHISVCAIQPGSGGRLWCSTSGGLTLFDPANESFDNFSESDGLISKAFLPASSFRTSDGTVYLGSEYGITIIRPEEISRNEEAPLVRFTSLKTFEGKVPISEGEDGILASSILVADEITLSPNDKVITVEFSALNMISSANNEYAHFLDGYDDDWIYSGNSRRCTYMNLAPGEYTLRVKASNNDGVWNELGASIRIRVLPTLFQTVWFWLLIASLIAVLCLVLYRKRIRTLRKQKESLEGTVQERTKELTLVLDRVEEQNEEISRQNLELIDHRENLESMVKERTEELEVAKNRAELSDRLKTSFLANMSHEIRTPMNAIMGFIQILERSNVTEDERKEFTKIINANCRTLMVLIDDILDLSRLEAGEVDVVETRLALNHFMEELELTFKNQVIEKDVSLFWNREGKIEEDEILVDETRLHQIIGNLLGNALKFTRQGSIVFGYRLVGQDLDEPRLQFFVEDTGIGISEKNIDLIFERFGKIENEAQNLYRGVGLGLPIARKLVTLMGGEISVNSELGKGSRFEVLLPYSVVGGLVSSKQAEQPHEVDSGKSDYERAVIRIASRSKMRILIAEDEDPNYKYIEKILRPIGAELIRVEDGNAAIEGVARHKPDLVLMDVKMPELDGLAAIRQLRANGCILPIIVQTAYSMTQDEEECLNAGANYYLSKPFGPLDLFEKMEACLELDK